MISGETPIVSPGAIGRVMNGIGYILSYPLVEGEAVPLEGLDVCKGFRTELRCGAGFRSNDGQADSREFGVQCPDGFYWHASGSYWYDSCYWWDGLPPLQFAQVDWFTSIVHLFSLVPSGSFSNRITCPWGDWNSRKRASVSE